MPVHLRDVSVVIPTRNEAHNIRAFLSSLHPDVELIVVDAGNDGTDALITNLRPKRTKIILSDAPIALARQMGAEAAQGQWLIFSDADVCFEPAYFTTFAHSITGDAFYGPKYATRTYPRYSQFFNACQRTIHKVGVPAASGSNMGVRRNVFDQVGGFRRDLPVNEDTELMMRVRHRGFTVNYVRSLAVRSLDDRRLDRGLALKTLHSVGRSLLLFINLYVPMPRRWLCHDWGYWSIRNARRSDLRDISARY